MTPHKLSKREHHHPRITLCHIPAWFTPKAKAFYFTPHTYASNMSVLYTNPMLHECKHELAMMSFASWPHHTSVAHASPSQPAHAFCFTTKRLPTHALLY
ncbi:hypothetical protein PIB30_111994, partial [Stylosanthes scabra]|nr:hypothetical protein [Stylosanthes scabra]